MKLKKFFSDANKVYKQAQAVAHTLQSGGKQLGIFVKYPELAGKLKYVFDDKSQITEITATVANDSKIDLRTLPKKIKGVNFKPHRAKA